MLMDNTTCNNSLIALQFKAFRVYRKMAEECGHKSLVDEEEYFYEFCKIYVEQYEDANPAAKKRFEDRIERLETTLSQIGGRR